MLAFSAVTDESTLCSSFGMYRAASSRTAARDASAVLTARVASSLAREHPPAASRVDAIRAMASVLASLLAAFVGVMSFLLGSGDQQSLSGLDLVRVGQDV